LKPDNTMAENSQDIWSRWLLHRRDAGDLRQRRRIIEYLRPVRDRVLDNASLENGGTLLDVGCGDGLIAFGALERNSSGTVIFSDISQDLLDHVKSITQEMGLANRCQFLRASAEDLSGLEDNSMDAVTTRSVLIYVRDKLRAFREFYRVLKPGGRMSLSEPINRFAHPSPDHIFAGYDVSEVVELARKVKEVFRQAQPDEDDPMVNFDERDLLRFTEGVGFKELHLNLDVDVGPIWQDISWESFLRSSPNPLAPTLEEAVSQSLTEVERQQFLSCLRHQVEGKKGIRRLAVAYLWAVKEKGSRILAQD
jgi:arsenite methyltransferase